MLFFFLNDVDGGTGQGIQALGKIQRTITFSFVLNARAVTIYFVNDA